MAREMMTASQINSHTERILAKVPVGAADAADVASVMSDPKLRSPHSWFSAWVERAGRLRQQAREALERGDPTGASQAYLRASEYFRAAAAVYWPERGDAAIADAMHLHSACFRASLDIDGPVYQQISIAIDGSKIDGYLVQSHAATEGAPLLICYGPSDGTAEEQYLLAGRAALERGWAVALVDPRQLVEHVTAPGNTGEDPFFELAAAFAEFSGVEPAEMAIGCIGSGAGLNNYLSRWDDPPEVIWLMPSTPDLIDLKHRIRAPGSSNEGQSRLTVETDFRNDV